VSPAGRRAPAGVPLTDVTVVLDDVRSLYNVGAVMRACDGAGIRRLVAGGITPYPAQGPADRRRRPIAERADRELRKTALAAYETVRVDPVPDVRQALAELRAAGATLVAIERTPEGDPLWQATALDARPLAIVLGHEVAGLRPDVLTLADAVVTIPMLGAGRSLNVAVATGIVVYEVVRRRAMGAAGPAWAGPAWAGPA
jgi:23S rRNA (guanosine2251-2'-O)-methyltransferase